MPPKLQTDVARPTALPSANLGKRRRALPSLADEAGGDAGPPGAAAERALDAWAEEWNVRIDRDVKGVVGGLREVVELAETPNAATHLPLRVSSLIRATQRLRDAAHDLRLALLVSDDAAAAARRDAEAARTRREIEALRGDVRRGLRGLVGVEDDEQPEEQGGEDDAEEAGASGAGGADGQEGGAVAVAQTGDGDESVADVAPEAAGEGQDGGGGGQQDQAASLVDGFGTRPEPGGMDVDAAATPPAEAPVVAVSAGEADISSDHDDGDDDFEVVDA